MTDEKLKVVFMGTPDFAVPTLKALIEDGRFSVDGVFTQPDRPKGRGRKLTMPPVKMVAVENGITVYQPQKARDPESVAALKGLAPDYLVVVAYGQILPESILEIPKFAPVNLHASLLPRWRGAAPIHRAFLAGDTVTGACSMFMDKGLDTGDMLLCRRTEITEEDTVGRLHDRLALNGADLMVETLIDYADGKIIPEKQDDEKATYAKKLEKSDFIIDWSLPAEMVSRHIRGLSPFPGAASGLNGKTVKPLFALADEGADGGNPGQVVSVSEEGIKVACGSGSVLITRLKPEGKEAMSAHAFINGRQIKLGDNFG